MFKKVVVTFLCLAIAGALVYFKFSPRAPANPVGSSGAPTKTSGPPDKVTSDKVVAPTEIPKLGPAGDYKMNGDTLDVELSVWPGYAPIIVANGGLEPNPESHFFKKHGFKLKIVLSEAEAAGWEAINSGKVGVNATTVDVLALYGNQLKVEAPIQLDFSRGGDGILVTKDISSINQLKGKTITVAQFTESDFFIRYLAQEAGLKIKPLKDAGAAADPECVNLLFANTAFDAADVFVESVKKGDRAVSGTVTWSPKTVEIPAEFPDKVRLLTTNRNLLVVADILIVNAGFAKQNPTIVKGLVEGILSGVEMIRQDPQGTTAVVAKAFKMAPEEMKASLGEVHLSNHAENIAFFAGEAGQVGNFNELYYTAVYAYGKDIIPSAVAPEKLVNRRHLEEIGKEGLFAGQTISVGPIKVSEKGEVLEKNPLLTKQIRFRFQPNSADLDLADAANQEALNDLIKLLKLTPGSFLMLRGHLDNSKVEEFKQKGEAFYRKQAIRAVEQSKQRAESVKAALTKTTTVDAARLDTDGRGWDEPLPGVKPEENRRVEVQLFTLE